MDLRKFKRACEKAAIVPEIRAREFYEKPTAVRKRKMAAAIKRAHKTNRKFSFLKAKILSLICLFLDTINQDFKGGHAEQGRCLGVIPYECLISDIKKFEIDERVEADDAI